MPEKKKSDVGPVCPTPPESPSASLPCPAEEKTNREDNKEDKEKAASKAESKSQNVKVEPEEEVPFCKTNDEESGRKAEDEDVPAYPARSTLPVPEEPKICPPELESFVTEPFKGICPSHTGMKCSAHACNREGIGKGSSGNSSGEAKKSNEESSCPPLPNTKNKTCRQEKHCEKH